MNRKRSTGPATRPAAGAALLRLAGAAACAALLCAGEGDGQARPDKSSYDVALGQTHLGYRRANGTDGGSFSGPMAAAVDRGHLYIADAMNGRVLGWKDATAFRNGFPADLVLGQSDPTSGERYRSDASSVSRPTGLAVDKDGTLWVSDADNGRILGFRDPFDSAASKEDRLTADFLIGQPEFGLGFADRSCNGGAFAAGPTSSATDQSLCEPTGLTTDPAGNLYVADRLNHRVLMFKAPIPDRYAKAELVLGHDTAMGNMKCNRSAAVAPPDDHALCAPQGLYFDGKSTPMRLFVADTENNRVIVFNDPVGTDRLADQVLGQRSLKDNLAGTGMDRLNKPTGVTLDGSGNVWVSDTGSHRVLGFIAPSGVGPAASYLIGQLDGNGAQPNQGIFGRPVPTPTATTLWSPRGGVFDGKGRLILPDAGNHRVLAYDTPQRITAVATKELGQPDFVHGADGRVDAGALSYPVSIAVDRPSPTLAQGQTQAVYVADFGNSRVLAWRDLFAMKSGRPADLVIGQKSMLDHTCNQGRGVSPTTLCYPRGVAVDKEGNLWVADTWNHRVVRFPKPFAQKGVDGQPPVHTADIVFGQSSFLGGLYNMTGNPTPSQRSLASPVAVAVEDSGVVWIADRDNNRVLGWAPPYKSAGDASYLLVGPGLGATDTGCKGTPASLCAPTGLAVDPAGALWVADRDNNRVARYGNRPVAPETLVVSSTPTAVLGQPSALSNLQNNGVVKKPVKNSLYAPEGVALELRAGSGGGAEVAAIIVADSGNNRVLVYEPITAGFQPDAVMVFGQGDSYEQQAVNIDSAYYDRAVNVERGLFNPGAVAAVPEGLLIADSGDTSRLTVRSGLIQPVPGDTGNSRVLLVKGPGFPNIPDSVDMAAPADLAEPVMEPVTPEPSGCSCDLGRGGAASVPGGALALLALGLLLRARRRR